MQLAVLDFSHDILSDKMRKHVSQAAALGCQGNITEKWKLVPRKRAQIFA